MSKVYDYEQMMDEIYSELDQTTEQLETEIEMLRKENKELKDTNMTRFIINVIAVLALMVMAKNL